MQGYLQPNIGTTNLLAGQTGLRGANSEWFNVTGTDVSTCDAGYTSSTVTFPGYPGFQEASLQDFSAGEDISVCMRQRYPGTAWGPWQFFTGTVVKSFRLNNLPFLGVGSQYS